MNWDALGAIAELIGALGVVLSLLYLGRQIRYSADQNEQSTRALRASTYQAVGDALQARNALVLTNPALAETTYRGFGGREHLSREEKRVFDVFVGNLLTAMSSAHFQFSEGLLPEEEWLGLYELLAYQMNRDGFYESYRFQRATLPRRFRRVAEAARARALEIQIATDHDESPFESDERSQS